MAAGGTLAVVDTVLSGQVSYVEFYFFNLSGGLFDFAYTYIQPNFIALECTPENMKIIFPIRASLSMSHCELG